MTVHGLFSYKNKRENKNKEERNRKETKTFTYFLIRTYKVIKHTTAIIEKSIKFHVRLKKIIKICWKNANINMKLC